MTTISTTTHDLDVILEADIQACMAQTGLQHTQARNTLVCQRKLAANKKAFPLGKSSYYTDADYEDYLRRVPAEQRQWFPISI